MSKKRVVIWIIVALLIIGFIVSASIYVKRGLIIRPGPGPGVPPEKLFSDYNKTNEDIPVKGIPWQDAQ